MKRDTTPQMLVLIVLFAALASGVPRLQSVAYSLSIAGALNA